jgi:hypothetical protein
MNDGAAEDFALRKGGGHGEVRRDVLVREVFAHLLKVQAAKIDVRRGSPGVISDFAAELDEANGPLAEPEHAHRHRKDHRRCRRELPRAEAPMPPDLRANDFAARENFFAHRCRSGDARQLVPEFAIKGD